MDYQDTLLVVKSKTGKGSSLADLSYNIHHIHNLKKDYDIQIGLRSFHLNDILFEIIAGQNTIQWYEIKYPLPGDIRIATTTLTPGFYTKTQFVALLETAMKNFSLHGITYFVTFSSSNRVIITTNKAPTDKQFLINNTGPDSAWNVIGFNVGLQTTYATTITADNRAFYDDALRLDIYTNLIRSNNYSTFAGSNTNQIIADLDVKNPGVTSDYYHFFDSTPAMFEASDSNSKTFYIKFYNCETNKLVEFTAGATYEISFIVRQKYKAALIRKSMTITKGEIVAIVQELMKEKARNNKTTVEKKLKEKKPELPKKK